MDQVLTQLGDLVLGAVPTMVLLLTLYAAYNFLVHRPLKAVLAERHARTEGAIEKAQADVAAAEAKTAEYEARLRDARLAVFKAQEQRRKEAEQVREQLLSEARAKADARVREAKTAIENDVQSAKSGLQADAERLANDIIRTILKPVGATPVPATGGQR
jgi:F-type H+-transporting ATPase subunit b